MAVKPRNGRRNAGENHAVRDELVHLVDIEPMVGRTVQGAETRGQPVGHGLPVAGVHPRRQRDGRSGDAEAHGGNAPGDMDDIGGAVARHELPEGYESGDAGHRRQKHQRQGHRQRSLMRPVRGMQLPVLASPEDIVVQAEHVERRQSGDGGHQHPTQTLADLLTIRSLKGRLDNMTIGLCGDLKFGRTVHSLISALIRYPGIKFVLISPEELRIPSYIREDVLRANNIPFTEVERLEDAIPQLDVLYMTRVQKERFFNEEDYVRLKDFYILTKAKMELAPEDMIVLHPLPRVNEISVEVDDDPRAVYFKQAQYAVYVRMALILTLLEIKVE